jgi:hypothetical protein
MRKREGEPWAKAVRFIMASSKPAYFYKSRLKSDAFNYYIVRSLEPPCLLKNRLFGVWNFF